MFSAIFIRRPRFAFAVSLFIMLAGLICVFQLPVAEYPEVSPPTVVVFTNYPGASSQVIADTIAAPIEKEVNSVEDLIYYSSTSDNSGGYSLTLTFKPDCDPDIALVNVNNAVKRAERNLPSEVVMNGITAYKRSSDILGIFAFSSDKPEHTPLFISNYVSNNIVDAVQRVEGVGQAIIFGELKYSMRVWLDPLRMRYYQIGQSEIVNAIQGQNIQAATGSIGTEGSNEMMQFKLETKGRLREVSEFEGIIVRSGDNARQVKLSDVARVELGAESYAGQPMLNGHPAAVMAIFKLNDGNALRIVKDVRALLERLQPYFPEGLGYSSPYDSTEFVQAAMEEIITTLLLTFSLVILITYIFLQDWRTTIIPAAAIPVSLIGTFAFLYALGMSINTLTLFGLILAIGSVVDDAIVVVECCMRLIHDEGLSPAAAAYQSMEELSTALIATAAVVIAIYTPIAFYGGMVGTIYKQFAVTMSIALAISALVALTLSPAMCALILRDTGEPKGPFKLFNYGLDVVRSGYLGVARVLSIGAGTLMIPILGVLLFGNYHMYNIIPKSFVPQEDKGALFCEVVLPPGAALPRTQATLVDLSDSLREIEGIRTIMSIPGRSMTSGNGENVAMSIVSLDHWSKRKTPETAINVIQQKVQGTGAAMTEASMQAFVPPAIQGLGATGGISFALQATGDQTLQDLYQSSNHLMGSIMGSQRALFTMQSLDVTTPMFNLDIDRAKAEAMKVPIRSILNALQGQLGSIYVNDFNLHGKTYQVKIQSEAAYRDNMNSIGLITVPATTGHMVPVDTIAKVEWVLGSRQVERFNMFLASNIRVQTLPGTSSGEMMNMIQNMVKTDLPEGYQISWTDMSYQEDQNEGQIVTLILLAIIFAYLFLVAQYESWTTPISVMLSTITATLGGMFAVRLTGLSLDIYCQLGLLMLIGLTAKTAILMVEYSKQLREDGDSIYDAAIGGMRVRFRAVMMTALSFVIGVAPMVVATGAGAGSRVSIGVTTFFGMLTASVVGMMLIPPLFILTRSMSEATKKLFGIDPNPKRKADTMDIHKPSSTPM